jgi:hypothetical protein
MTARNRPLTRKILFQIRPLFFAILVSVAGNGQQSTTDATTGERSGQVSTHCGNKPNCVDGVSYTATVTNIIESTTATHRMVRLIVRFENVSDHTIILAYRAGSGFLLDNFGNRYFCSQGGQTGPNAQDNSAVGIGTDRDNKVDPLFMLKPTQSESASFDLSRKRPPDQQASFYDFDVMIDEVDSHDPVTVLTHPYVSFRNLRARVTGPRLSDTSKTIP